MATTPPRLAKHDLYCGARAWFNTYGPLLELGQADQAEAVLVACQHVFEAEQDVRGLARTLTARAELASNRGHHDDAATVNCTALRLLYTRPEPGDVAAAHQNLGRSAGAC